MTSRDINFSIYYATAPRGHTTNLRFTCYPSFTVLCVPPLPSLVFKRFMSGKNVIGHAHKVIEAIYKTPEQLLFTKKVSQVNQTTVSTSSSLQKEDKLRVFGLSEQVQSSLITLKNVALRAIPSIRPSRSNLPPILDQKGCPIPPFVIQNKESLAMFLQFFETLPDNLKNNPKYLLLFYKVLTEQHPEILTRVYQMCFETSYNKRLFTEKDICDVFDNTFSMEDIIGRNKNMADMGTYFTAIQANYLYTQPGFSSSIDSCVILPTCINSSDLKDLSPKLLSRISYIQQATGNMVNDLDLNGHPFDFKNEYSFGRNHISFYSYEKLCDEKVFLNYSKRLIRLWADESAKLRKDPANNESVLTEFKKLSNKLLLLQKENLSSIQKFQLWNEYIFQTLHKRPRGVFTPLVIPTTMKPYEAHPAMVEHIKRVEIPPHKHLEHPDIKRAILNFTSKWRSSSKRNLSQETGGSLGEDTEN